MIDRDHVEAWMLLLGFEREIPLRNSSHRWFYPDRWTWGIQIEMRPPYAVRFGNAPLSAPRWEIRTNTNLQIRTTDPPDALEGVVLRTTDPADALEKIKQLVGDRPDDR